MTTPLPPIDRDSRRLRVHTQQRVMRFARDCQTIQGSSACLRGRRREIDPIDFVTEPV